MADEIRVNSLENERNNVQTNNSRLERIWFYFIGNKARYNLDTLLRLGLTFWACYIVQTWLFSVLDIVKLPKEKALESSVAIALLSTTTLNVLGLTFIILKGLFPASEGR